MNKWNVLSEYKAGLDVVDLLLNNRDVKTKEEREQFLNPPPIKDYLKNLSSDFKQALKKAKELVDEAIKNGVPIIIYGDYDSDGINATAILYSTIKDELGYEKVSYFIPNRFDHGYGLSIAAIDAVLATFSVTPDQKVLFITVDTGITAKNEIDYIKSLGHKIILTDHHQKPEQPPEPDVLVWNDAVVGAGISWILSRILGSTSATTIALAALATVTDLYPVLGINRAIVKKGLEVLNTNPPVGLKKLLQVSGKQKAEVTTYDLGWVLGPRLNATGRLVEAKESLQLLLEKDEIEAETLALKLNQVNVERQNKTLEMYEVAGTLDGVLPKVIFSSSENYHEGIIGLVASKISQRHYRPSVVISLTENFGKGSVRSIVGIDIISILRNFNDLFENLGGHPMAAGFTIKKENIPLLQQNIISFVETNFSEELFVPVMTVDLKIPINLVNLDLLKEIEKLKPFGLGNSEPTFLSENVSVASSNIIGRDGKHLSIKLFDGEKYYKAVWFNGVEKGITFAIGDKIDLVYTLSRNEYNGNVYVDLIVKDVRVK